MISEQTTAAVATPASPPRPQSNSSNNPRSAPDLRNSLPKPMGVTRKIAWHYVIAISTIHALALFACVPWLFSWSGLILCLVGTHVFGSGINIGYHRLLTHRSFRCSRSVERFFVILGICCFEDTPATWVATHRLHHRDSDEQPDPHSPLVDLWWGHMGWLMFANKDVQNLNTYDRIARDVLKDPFYMWLQRGINGVLVYVLHAVAFAATGFFVGWWWGGTVAAGVQLGLSWLVWAVILRTVIVWHMTWSVNSLSHVFGYRNHDTAEHSRNNWFVSAIAAGEGWHNNHHHDPTSASNWHRWWEFDLSYCVIWTMAKLGLAWDVNPPRRSGPSQKSW